MTAAQKAKIHRVLSEFHAGTLRSSSGQAVTDRRQALAIALSEAGLSREQYRAHRKNRKKAMSASKSLPGADDSGLLIFMGGEVKSLDDSGRIGGPLVVFGSADDTDREGDYFTAETDFGRHYKSGLGVYYVHGLPRINGKPNPLEGREIGDAEVEVKDAHVWMTGQLALRDDYEREVWRGVKSHKMGLSSGAVQHLVRRERRKNGANRVIRWPLVEGSITPTPMEPKTYVRAIKSLDWLMDTTATDPAVKDYGDPDSASLDMGDSALMGGVNSLFDSARMHVAMCIRDVRKDRADKIDACQAMADSLGLTLMKLINVFLKDPSDETAAEMKTVVDTFGSRQGFDSLVSRLQTCAGTASALAQVVGRWDKLSEVKAAAILGLGESLGTLQHSLTALATARGNWVDPAVREAKRRDIQAKLARAGLLDPISHGRQQQDG